MWSLTQFLLGKLPETANFREISIYPSIEELLTEEKPNLKANIIKGPYQDVDHYLDVQFRLTREDYIAPLRDGIQYYRNNSALSNDGKNQTVWIHEGVKIGESKCARHKGVLHELHFNEKEFSKIKWDTPTASKRFIHGSLLCLSNDNFETIRSAVVSDPKDLQKGIVIVKFQDDFRVNKSNSPRVYTVAELQTFFEAYRPMLQGLQTFNTGNLPLQKYIIKVQQQLDPPAYLNYSSKYKFTVKIQESNYFKSGRVLDINDWPETEILSLDESQREAMHLALTSSLAIIQGPPGTGKTHVALKIMQTLLNNQKIWLGKEKSNPILVVAVTNRALDQFLEGVLQFTQSIIRVGSQSKSEKLEKYTLMYIQEQARLNRKKQDFLSTTIKETETRLQKLRRTLESNIQFIENFHTSIFEERVFTYISTYDHRLVESLEHGWCDIFKVDSFIYSRWNPISYLRSWLGITLDDMFISNRELEYFLHGGWNEKDEVCRKIKAVLGIWRVTLTEVVDPKIGVSRNSPQCVDNHIAITGTYSRGYHQGVSVINRNCRTANVSNYLKSDTKPNNFRKSKSYIAKESQLLVNSGKLRISIVQRELATSDFMTDEEISCVRNVWSLSLNDRWRLYLKLRNKLKDTTVSQISKLQKEYEDLAKTLQRLFNERKINTLRQCDVIGMTTTCAATNLEVLSCINPKIVIVEEAAKVLESHIICALTSDTQHLILIGDHKQLRPQVNVDRLAKQYHLDISLFERLIHNNIGYATLQIQHRMRPEISQLLVPYIYKNLTNHPDVEQYPQIKGVTSNMFFLNHNVMEDKTKDIELHVNSFEANYLVALCRYFLQQSYEPSQITILTAYNGQLNALQKRLAKDNYFEGVRLTTVDGYQGEENDIILISFVRNNKKGQIGFLKFDNRVNVAISRARMGLYCVGNFELFATKSEFWASVMDILKRDGSVGYKLTLKCQQHGTLTMVKTANDFKKFSPDGGCLRSCDQVLDCGHVCKRMCHKDPHTAVTCMEPCMKVICKLNHYCRLKCFEKCERFCRIPVLKELSNCQHSEWQLCYEDIRDVICRISVERRLLCGHVVSLECHMDVTVYKCRVKVTKKLPLCDHSIEIMCYQSQTITDLKCNVKVIKRSPYCDHSCEMSCHESQIPGYKCRVQVIKKLSSCDHYVKMSCYLITDYKCDAKVIKKSSSCDHSVEMLCYQSQIVDVTNYKCDVKVKRKLSFCGHIGEMFCHQNPQTVPCQLKCNYVLRCGHICPRRCHVPVNPKHKNIQCGSCSGRSKKCVVC